MEIWGYKPVGFTVDWKIICFCWKIYWNLKKLNSRSIWLTKKYVYKPDDISNKWSNTYQRTIKMKPVNVVADHVRIQNINTLLQKINLQIHLKRLLSLKN